MPKSTKFLLDLILRIIPIALIVIAIVVGLGKLTRFDLTSIFTGKEKTSVVISYSAYPPQRILQLELVREGYGKFFEVFHHDHGTLRFSAYYYGDVRAGCDLECMSFDYDSLDRDSLVVHLPEPRILTFDLDRIRTRTHIEIESGNWESEDIHAYHNTHEMACSILIVTRALDEGILDRAKVRAEQVLTNFYTGLGFQHLVFDWQPD